MARKTFLHRRRRGRASREWRRDSAAVVSERMPCVAARRTSSNRLVDVERLRQVFEGTALVGGHVRCVEVCTECGEHDTWDVCSRAGRGRLANLYRSKVY